MQNYPNIKALVHREVIIEWRDRKNDWEWFRVLGLDLHISWICLEGMDAPGGTKHDGSVIWVPMADISSIMLK